MNIVESLLEYHMLGPFEIIEWTILEDAADWTVGETKSYRKGFKKYQTDARVMQSLHEIITFVTNQQKQPRFGDYPIELYVHALSTDNFSQGTLTCHLKGQKICLLFRPNYQEKSLELIALGTHQDFGWR